jgi:hypothetical protein
MLPRPLCLVVLLAACGASDPPPGPPVLSDPAPEPASAVDPPPAGPARCEGLLAGCGFWSGCVMVRADATTPGRFVGVGPDAGHFYRESRDCDAAGVCTEVCTGGSESHCRPGLVADGPPSACSEAAAPSRAPFTCTMIDGACVQGPDPATLPAS